MFRFKVLAGFHNEGGVTYKTGDIVDSKMNLLELNNGHRKFEKVESVAEAAERGFNGSQPVEKVPKNGPDEFDAMTIPDLKKFAAQEGLDLGTATKKDEILTIIRAYAEQLLGA